MKEVFTLYRPIVSGLDEVNHLIKEVAEDLDLDASFENTVQWGLGPRVAVFRAIGRLGEFLATDLAPKLGRELRAAAPDVSASTKLWGKDLGDDGRFPQINLAHDQRSLGVDPRSLVTPRIEQILQIGLGNAIEQGIGISKGVSNRANGMSNFAPLPMMAAPGVSDEDLKEFREGWEVDGMPVLGLGALSMAIHPDIDDGTYWPNYGHIPSTR